MAISKDHAHFTRLLERHLDGDISDGERMELFNHLERCDDCRRILEAEERLLTRLGEIPRLVAPSDLRARIVKQAARERIDVGQALSEDERFTPLFNPSPARIADEETDPDADVPRFESIPVKPRLGRARLAWRRYSPAAATLFMVVAAFAALLTGNFRGMPMLQQTQAKLWDGAERAYALVRGEPTPAPQVSDQTAVEFAAASDTSPSPGTGNTSSINIARPASSPEAAQSAWIAGYIAGRFDDIKSRVESVTGALAAAVPQPAEQTPAALATVVIKCAERGDDFSFETDEFDEAIRSGAREHLAGTITNTDQFAFRGHRYHCYTVQITDLRLQELVNRLEQYRTSEDVEVVQVLRDQASGSSPPRNDQLAFYSACGPEIKNAIMSMESLPRPPNPRDQREVQIVVVE